MNTYRLSAYAICMGLYQPFSTEQKVQLANLLVDREITVGEFSALRQKVCGETLALPGLRDLTAAEPSLAPLLQTRIFPAILRYARALLVAGDAQLPTHDAGQSGRIRIPRIQVAGWIAHMFLGTLPQQTPEHPVIDFAYLLCAQWPQELAKLRCVLAYFDRIAETPPSGYLEIERLVTTSRTAAEWEADPSPLQPLTVDPTGVIEDADGCRQVDFANRYLGGGVLTGGCVQEEIRFAMAPELFCGMIVSPKMGRAEAIVLRGAERFVKTRGYARSLQYAGPYSDPCDRAADGTPDIELVAIDAIDYRHAEHTSQFSELAILRELNKARSGFLRDARQLPVACGNWGCGVFGGDPPLKAVIQWLAASAEGRALRYFSFGDARVGELAGFAETVRARKVSVGAVFKRLLAAHEDGGTGLYQRLLAA